MGGYKTSNVAGQSKLFQLKVYKLRVSSRDRFTQEEFGWVEEFFCEKAKPRILIVWDIIHFWFDVCSKKGQKYKLSVLNFKNDRKPYDCNLYN